MQNLRGQPQGVIKLSAFNTYGNPDWQGSNFRNRRFSKFLLVP
jgi:hypothetical protein